MSAPGERRCLVCGARRRVEEHHVAARGNDPGFVRYLCAACHAELTAWQWRLGIVHRGTGREDAPELTALQRAWATVEGTVLLGILLDPEGTATTAHALGRAAGVTARMADDIGGSERPLGPTPAWGRREAQEARPAGRGPGDAQALLDLGLEASARLAPDMQLEEVRDQLPRVLEWLRRLDADPGERSDLGSRTAAVERALRTIAAAASLEELMAEPEAPQTLAEAARIGLALLSALSSAASEAEAREAARKILR